jgi:nitrite reductase/ring-hydroxylating ferredoxin subunit
MEDPAVDAGAVAELQQRGMLLTKVGTHGVCVLWHDGQAYAVDDRCPHLGFPLHRGTVEH